MTFQCEDARPLVPAYLDGEVSEAQAGLLRKHLLSCRDCRSTAQDGKALKRWFEPLATSSESAPVEVPPGFAARVARRAFAGDAGEQHGIGLEAGAPSSADSRDSVLRLVLNLTALAAGIMLVLSIALRSERLPSGSRMRAADDVLVPLDDVLEDLRQMNERDDALAPPADLPAELPSEDGSQE